MVFSVKFCHSGDIHRRYFARIEDVTMTDIHEFVVGSFGFEDYTAKYIDEDGDACTLTALTLPDAVHTAQQAGSALKLEVTSGQRTSSSGASGNAWLDCERE